MGQNYEKHEENYDDSLNLNKVFQRKNRVDKKKSMPVCVCQSKS